MRMIIYIGYDYTIFFYFYVICEESQESMIEIKPCECVCQKLEMKTGF